jgi:carboxynorspermidine decarboxylase
MREAAPDIDPQALAQVETPAYVVDLQALDRNLAILGDVQTRSGGRILLALKGFAMWRLFPRISRVLSGVTASSPAEARLGREEFGKEVHAYAPAYSQADIDEIITLVDHLVFNSPGQYLRFRDRIAESRRRVSCGLRVNPEHSEVHVPIYDPCAPGSRLGTTAARLAAAGPEVWEGLEGLHFHALCELGCDALERTLAAFEARFGRYVERLKWVNFGGGHLITHPDYDVERLVELVADFRRRYGVEVYLEPGEAVALNAGVLVSSVLDVIHNGTDTAILDTSATAHMPDVLEMPYRPQIIGSGPAGEKAYTVRLGGLTCLAGDVIGDYSFDAPLQVGDRVIFKDMAHYTMVKNTAFNGVRLPSIATYDPRTGTVEVLRRFGYEDYKRRLS